MMQIQEQQSVVAISPSSGGVGPDGYSLWEYDGDRWKLKKICAIGDAVPGDPPAGAGKFKGQLRSTPCVAAVGV